tara:strand:+ start:51 stop:572 length:522 start_codon:yes stop_codon:yes gene_type:complete
MSGIMEMIELFRGEAPSRSGMAKGFGDRSGRFFTSNPKFARHIARGGSMSQGNLIGDLKGKVKSLKIPLSKYKELGGNSLQVILDNESLGKAKTNTVQTLLARAGSFTPLAMKGLTYLASLPAATAMMILSPTKMGNGELDLGEANMKLEDFAKLNEGSTNVDKTLSTEIGDM